MLNVSHPILYLTSWVHVHQSFKITSAGKTQKLAFVVTDSYKNFAETKQDELLTDKPGHLSHPQHAKWLKTLHNLELLVKFKTETKILQALNNCLSTLKIF